PGERGRGDRPSRSAVGRAPGRDRGAEARTDSRLRDAAGPLPQAPRRVQGAARAAAARFATAQSFGQDPETHPSRGAREERSSMKGEGRMTLTRTLAKFTTGLTHQSIPAEVVEKARVCLLNGYGIGLGSHGTPYAPVARRAAIA